MPQIKHKSEVEARAFTDDGRCFASAEKNGHTVVVKDVDRNVELVRISHPTYVHEIIDGAEAGINVSWKLSWLPVDSSVPFSRTMISAEQFRYCTWTKRKQVCIKGKRVRPPSPEQFQ